MLTFKNLTILYINEILSIGPSASPDSSCSWNRLTPTTSWTPFPQDATSRPRAVSHQGALWSPRWRQLRRDYETSGMNIDKTVSGIGRCHFLIHCQLENYFRDYLKTSLFIFQLQFIRIPNLSAPPSVVVDHCVLVTEEPNLIEKAEGGDYSPYSSQSSSQLGAHEAGLSASQGMHWSHMLSLSLCLYYKVVCDCVCLSVCPSDSHALGWFAH